MSRPNLLVFLTDDHGQWASSAYGHRELHTPVMQWMADTGACFQRASCPNAVCSPARASFWTGKIPSAHGVHDWLGEPNEQHPHPGIRNLETLGTLLSEEGYRCGMVGKWHAGPYAESMPGFHTWFTSLMGTNASMKTQKYVDNGERKEFFGHQEQILSDRAVQFLREERPEEEPFFLFVGYTNTHTPHQMEGAPLTHHYRKCSFEDIPRESDQGEHGHTRIEPFDLEDPDRRESLAGYYAAVECIDQQLLRIVSELENQGILDDTLILYTSDHGHMNGHHGLHTKANATLPNNFLQESIRVPLLLRGPGIPAQPESVSAPVDHCDSFATLLDAAGLDSDTICQRLQSPGRSYLPLLQGTQNSWRREQFVEGGPNRMVEQDGWKFIQRWPHPSGLKVQDELYDLNKDPRETRNVAGDPAHAERIEAFKERIHSFYASYEDPEKSGIHPEALALYHNDHTPWNSLPGDADHRQS